MQKIATFLERKKLVYSAIVVYPITEGHFVHNCEVSVTEDILNFTCSILIADAS